MCIANFYTRPTHPRNYPKPSSACKFLQVSYFYGSPTQPTASPKCCTDLGLCYVGLPRVVGGTSGGVLKKQSLHKLSFEKGKFVTGFSRWVKGQAQALEPVAFQAMGQLRSAMGQLHTALPRGTPPGTRLEAE